MGSSFHKSVSKGNIPSKMKKTLPDSNEEIEDKKCVCHLETTDYCGICEQPSGTKSMYCPLHPQICGEAEPTCDKCTARGLELISGTGGPDEIIDHKNNGKTYSESELPLRPYIKNFE